VTSSRPLFSICIPAYNRAHRLPALLESVFDQSYGDYEVVICEDKSPEREMISNVVVAYEARQPGRIRYFENQENLGYNTKSMDPDVNCLWRC